MDQASNQAVDVISIAISFATLELNPSPINRLPNEILQHILSKVERMVPIKKFARFRLVDTRWRSAVDHIFECKKRLLLIVLDQYRFPAPQMDGLFLGLLDGHHQSVTRVYIQGRLEAPGGHFHDENWYLVLDNENIFELLLKALPNIEQLYIHAFDANGIEDQLAEYANSLDSLQQLHLQGTFASILDHLGRLPNSLSRLEFTLFNCRFIIAHKQFVRAVALNFDYVRQLHGHNPYFLASVTQLSFTVGLNDQFGQIVNTLREQATRLDVLYLKFCDTTQITPELFGHLNKLTRLKEIALGPVTFEVLKQTAKAIENNIFTSLFTITTCSLVIADLDFHSVTVEQFIRVLRVIFPNVLNWKFAFVPMPNYSFLTQLKQRNSNFSLSVKALDEFFELLHVS